MPASRVRQGLKAGCCGFALTLLTFGGVSAAGAQQVAAADRQAFLTSVSSTTTTSVVGGIIITVTVSSGTANLERYLRHNAVAVHHDVTRGAGPSVDDLADGFGVTDRRAFGVLLRKRRTALLGLVEHLDEAAARSFAALVLADIQQAGL